VRNYCCLFYVQKFLERKRKDILARKAALKVKKSNKPADKFDSEVPRFRQVYLLQYKYIMRKP